MEKGSNPSQINDTTIAAIYFLIPTLMLIIGFFLFPYPPSPLAQQLVYIPLFLGLILLGIGFLWKEKRKASKIKIGGWLLFSFFWATSPSYLYFSEGGDVFNAAVSIIGVYILIYVAYHEWLSIQRNQYPSCLNWIAGGSFIAGIIYFTIDSSIFPQIKQGLIDVVAQHSTILMNILGLEAYKVGHTINYGGTPITIIFACTAIQAMVLFVGMIGALGTISHKRKALGMVLTVIPIYFLNLVRNASVVFLIGGGITDFNIAHNVLAKIGALITLIALLFIVFKIIPELFDEISCLIDLPKRKGPVERFFINVLGKKAK